MKREKGLTCDDAVQADKQHTTPCSDCPWAREALNGWLGGSTPEEWLACAHSDQVIPCHVIDNMQCAGAAIYRANVVKSPRDPDCLRLPKDRVKVFASPAEFKDHHDKF
jgi:hypothetical protein